MATTPKWTTRRLFFDGTNWTAMETGTARDLDQALEMMDADGWELVGAMAEIPGSEPSFFYKRPA